MTRAVIMAGGLGTRISSMRSDVPKPMIPVFGRPVLQWQIEGLVRQGIVDITLVIGHLGDRIAEHFGDGSSFGARILYFREEEPLGTAGSLAAMRDGLTEDFLLLNGDIMMDVSFNAMLELHKRSSAVATIAVHPNSHPYDSAIVATDKDGWVTAWYRKDEERPACRNRVNAGVHILSPCAIAHLPQGRSNLDRDVLAPLVGERRLMAWRTTEYIKDMGTPDRYEQICREVAEGLPSRRRLDVPQRAVFFDRDGTINRHVGFVTSPEQLELLPGAAAAIRRVNDSGMLAIVVTNQPVIARGDCTWEELAEVNATLEELLGREGAYIDDLLVCPHHPDKGFDGERPEYKVRCSCRKPEPGLLLEAADRFNIDLGASWMVGDSWRDEEAGRAAGCRTFTLDRDGSFEDFCDLALGEKL